MHGEGLFIQAAIYLAAAVIAVPIAKRLGFGSVLGYLFAGIAIGPFVLGLVGEEGKDIMHFAEFGVVMMLFLIGLELRPVLLWKMRGLLLGMGGLQLGITAVVLAAIGLGFGYPWQAALAIGLILALSSTAIVLQTLSEKGLMRTDAGQSSLAVLLLQDIAVVPMLAALPLLAVAGAGSKGRGAGEAAAEGGHYLVTALPAWGQTLVVLGLFASIVVAGRFLVSPALRFIAKARLREMFTAAALLLVVGISLLTAFVGLSPALGAFLAGVVLANSEYRHELEADIEPFKGLLLGLFFIVVGASIDFNLIGESPELIAGLVVGLVVVKFLILFAIGRLFKMGLDQNLLFALALAQSGEFGFLLFSFAEQSNVLSSEVTSPLVATVALSMALTPLAMLINEKLVQPRFGTREREEREADEMGEEKPVIIAGFGRFGSIVGRLLRAQGCNATVLDLDSDNVDLLRKLGFKVFYGDASRFDLLGAAGAANARLLILAIDDPQKTLEMVHTAKKHFPHLKILARANSRGDAYELLEAGVDNVYRETFDTSLKMGVDALKLLGHRAHQAHRSSQKFKRYDEEGLRELLKVRHDQKAYISRARQRIDELEEILSEELKGHEEYRDAGWDVESRREAARAAAENKVRKRVKS
jgi:monovalent cation:proton antiporter-2 (CPA2) family protein